MTSKISHLLFIMAYDILLPSPWLMGLLIRFLDLLVPSFHPQPGGAIELFDRTLRLP
ncbi:MAG: hypothetical protein HY864_04890 [Chloroflexi bacterium]|nr:hypothetical protein [Chloroflexota bacterium]